MDEMNLHLPQSDEATAECQVIMETANHLVTAQRNGPVAGNIQDNLTFSYFLTSGETFVSRDMFMDCFFSMSEANQSRIFEKTHNRINFYPDADGFNDAFQSLLKRGSVYYPESIVKKGELYLLVGDKIDGRLLMSAVFPPALFYRNKTETSKLRPDVIIQRGILTKSSGPLCKRIIGQASGSLVQIIYKEYSPEEARLLLSRVQKLTNRWAPSRNFSMGIVDCTSTNQDKIVIEVAKAMQECMGVKDESKTNGILNAVMEKTSNLVLDGLCKGLSNSMKIMATVRSKGSKVNIIQIAGFLGQQNVSGKRIPKTISYGQRTLPCFSIKDTSPRSRGFIAHGYLVGLGPEEMFFHASAGRMGLIDTGLKTQDTGYLQKRFSKKLEDLISRTDGAVVQHASNKIVQYMYGCDGFDARQLTAIPACHRPAVYRYGDHFFCDDHKHPSCISIQCTHKFSSSTHSTRSSSSTPSTRSSSRCQKSACAADKPLCADHGGKIQKCSMAGNKFPFFIDPWRLARRLNSEYSNSDLKTARVLSDVERRLLLPFIGYKAPVSELTIAVNNALQTSLSKMLDTVFIVERAIPMFARQVRMAFEKTRLAYCSGVGLIAASSIGEPATQMTLNTFHMAGHSAKDVTLGVPRIEELVSIKKENASPGMTAYTTQEYNNEKLLLIATRMAYTTIDTFVKNATISTIGKIKHRVNIIKYAEFKTPWWATAPESGKYVITLELDKTRLYAHRCKISSLATIISKQLEDHVECIASPEAIGQILVYSTLDNLQHVRDVLIPQIRQIYVCGISGITRGMIRQDNNKKWHLDLQGSNILGVSQDSQVDTYKVVSNNLWEVFCTYGIEAARKFLNRELTYVLSFDGTYINPRHIGLLADAMTFTGQLTAVSRYGIDSETAGPAAKIFFEQTVDNAAIAAMSGARDNIKGSSASIAVGHLVPHGTGSVHLIKDVFQAF
jgi:DNA-directed RNA polymerase II subunit RPB1